jgi:hypothetical protein
MNEKLMEKLVIRLLDVDTKTNNDDLWKVGKSYFIRTVTMHVLGKLEKVTDKELLLSTASWVADSGRFNNFLATGVVEELEPFVNDVIVGRGAIIDATVWDHALPTDVK